MATGGAQTLVALFPDTSPPPAGIARTGAGSCSGCAQASSRPATSSCPTYSASCSPASTAHSPLTACSGSRKPSGTDAHTCTGQRQQAELGGRQALGWAPGHMGLWDKSLGDKGMTTQQSVAIPGIPQLPAKRRLQCSVPVLDSVSESRCSEGLGSHLQVCWGGRHLTELYTPQSSLAPFTSFGPLHSPLWWVLVSFPCTEEQLEALRS